MSLELKLSLPESLVKEAQAASLLTPETIELMLRQALRKR
jgi:hypothetical protein